MKVGEVIAELEEKLENAKLVLEHFPDARAEKLPDGRLGFVSKAALEVADQVEFQQQGDGFPIAITYFQLKDGPPALRVYADHNHLHDIAPNLLKRLQKAHPGGYSALVKLAKTPG